MKQNAKTLTDLAERELEKAAGARLHGGAMSLADHYAAATAYANLSIALSLAQYVEHMTTPEYVVDEDGARDSIHIKRHFNCRWPVGHHSEHCELKTPDVLLAEREAIPLGKELLDRG